MQAGIPIVASNISSIPEVTGDAALLVDPNDFREIREATIGILKNESLGNVMIAKGLSRSRQYSWEAVARQVFDLYDQLTAM